TSSPESFVKLARVESRCDVSLGPTELIIILAIVLVIFGGGRLGEIGGALGKGIREFKGAIKDEEPEPELPRTPPGGSANPRPACDRRTASPGGDPGPAERPAGLLTRGRRRDRRRRGAGSDPLPLPAARAGGSADPGRARPGIGAGCASRLRRPPADQLGHG